MLNITVYNGSEALETFTNMADAQEFAFLFELNNGLALGSLEVVS